MDLQEFLMEHYLRNYGQIADTAYGWQWKYYNALAELTNYVDYRCDFRDGVCAGHQGRYYKNRPAEKKMCCCSGCLRSVGYLRQIPNQPESMIEIARFFNKETGFWRAEKGCILPRKWRSAVCLTFACHFNKNEAHPADVALLAAIRWIDRAKVIKGKACQTERESVIELTAWIKEKKYEGDDTRRVSGSRHKRQLLEVQLHAPSTYAYQDVPDALSNSLANTSLAGINRM